MKRSTMRKALFLLLVGVQPAMLAAQDARLGSRLDPATAAEVSALVASARAAGLPTEPLVDRALEGASKGAGPNRIVAAVRALARDLTASRAALGAAAIESEVTAGAGALRAGADAGLLTRLRAARPPSASVTVPLGVLADLVGRGVPADTAARAVLALAQGGATDQDFVALRRNVERDIRAGAPPAIAAALRSRGMPSTLPPSLAPASGAAVTAAPGAADRATSRPAVKP